MSDGPNRPPSGRSRSLLPQRRRFRLQRLNVSDGLPAALIICQRPGRGYNSYLSRLAGGEQTPRASRASRRDVRRDLLKKARAKVARLSGAGELDEVEDAD